MKYIITKEVNGITHRLHSDGHFYWNIWNYGTRHLKVYKSLACAKKMAMHKGAEVVGVEEGTFYKI